MKMPGLQHHSNRKPGHLQAESVRRRRDLDPCAGLIAAELIDNLAQAFLAPVFHPKLFACGQALQVIDQNTSLHQKSPASLVTAETVKQFDRPPAS